MKRPFAKGPVLLSEASRAFHFQMCKIFLMFFLRNVFTCYVRFVFVTGMLRFRALVTGHGSRIDRLLPIRAES